MVSYLSGAAHPGVADIYEFGVPVWDANAATPRYHVNCTEPWGACGLEQTTVPIPDNAKPSYGSDGAMVVIDWSTRKMYEFWQAGKVNGTWQTSWGGVNNVDGDGTTNGPIGAGVSRLAGVVRTGEIAQGRINHALVFSTNNACQSVYRYPATKTDGLSARSDCLPEGTRIQLDPSINVDAIAGMSPGERAVAKALQTYGAYAVDNGGANMAFVFETPSGEADPYPGVGMSWDYYGFDHIPWNRLRVLTK